MVKEFSTAVKRTQSEKKGEREALPFKVDDDLLTAYKPDETQMLLLLAAASDYSDVKEKVAAAIRFVHELLDMRSQSIVLRRLHDRDDEFGLDEIFDISEWLMSEFSGNPTQEPSGSSDSPPSDGERSTAPKRKTHSRSR